MVLFSDPYPNPSGGDVIFRFIVTGDKTPQSYNLQIISLDGKENRSYGLDGQSLHVGSNQLIWNGANDLGTIQYGGLYLYRLIITVNGVAYTKNGKLIRKR
jgi:hypothetical protein